MKNHFHCAVAAVLLTAALLLPGLCRGAEKNAPDAVKVTVTTPETYLSIGSEAKFTITLKGAGSADRKVQLRIEGNDKIRCKKEITTDAAGTAVVTFPIEAPGVIYCQASCGGSTAAAAVATDLRKIKPDRPEPADFRSYWNKIKADFDATPLNAELTPVKALTPGVKVHKVKLPLGGKEKDAYGMLAVPANAKPKSLPARLIVFAANTDKVEAPEGCAKQGFVAFALNPMPIDNTGKSGDHTRRGKYQGYWRWFPDHREKIFFNGMFRRLYRGLQFIKSQPEWDGRILIVGGTSQGGGQALVAAGLDPQVTCVSALVPAFCNHSGKSEAGWPQYQNRGIFRTKPKQVLYATSYIDAANFARLITNADCYVSTGLLDRTCPTASVMAAYNVIPSKNKQIRISPRNNHRITGDIRRESERFIAAHVKKMQKMQAK